MKPILLIILGMISLNQVHTWPKLQPKDHHQQRIEDLTLKINKLKPEFPKYRAVYYANMILDFAKQYKIKPEIIMAIIKVESDYKTTQISYTADYGLMQINAIWLTHFNLSAKDLFDPYNNLKYGMKILAQHLKHKNEPCWFTRYHSKTPGKRLKYQIKLVKAFQEMGHHNRCMDTANDKI